MRVAIVGSGIAGNVAAYLLHTHHDITLYEKNDTLGGHSRTIDVKTPGGTVPVDTGFIVFNYRNYPLLTGLFNHLQVPVAKSDMSFGASIDHGWFEYGTQYTSNIIAQKSNLLRPQFWRMVYDVFRFQKKACAYLDKGPDITLGQCLDELKVGPWFREYFLYAMGGAIWSTPLRKMPDYPAATFIRFFDNHGLLSVNDQPQWYTVQGGSKEYVQRLTAAFKDKLRLNCGATQIRRSTQGVEIHDSEGNVEPYDQVILACHSDQALRLIDSPSKEEQQILGNIRYQPNKAILHSDTSFMPRRKAAWASWVYLCENQRDDNPSVSLSYWMNRLQPLNTDIPMIVTLNPGRMPDKALIHDEVVFEHPLFDEAAIRAQSELPTIQGKDRIWYAGAWQRYGFHEDGILSAVNVAKAMGVEVPWT